MFRNLNRRAALRIGRVVLNVAVLVIAGTATLAQAASERPNARQSDTLANDASAWRTQAYSKTSEFAQRLTLLEFSEKDDPACQPTTKLLNEMRRKNYPIQRVERVAGGEILFKQFEIQRVPTLVLLFDGNELGRLVVAKDDVAVTTKRLLALFQKGRDAVAANPRVRAKEPEYVSQAKPTRGLLFSGSLERAVKTLGQSPETVERKSAQTLATEASILDERTEEISNLIGEARLEGATIRVVVKSPDGGLAREGVGTAIHYNSEYHEALFVVSASLFVGVAEPSLYPSVTVEVVNAETGVVETSGAQCVRCDLNTGVAFVATQVASPIKPVAFLPKKSPLEPGERGVSFARRPDGVVKSYHDVSAVDQRRFYENSDEQSAYVSYVEATNPPAAQDVGAGLYAQRNGRFYFAGLFVSSADRVEARVVPATVVSQSLLVNRNLTTVYRDQIAGRFDAPASDAEIDAAIARLMALDAQKKTGDVAETIPEKTNAVPEEDVASAHAVALSEPISSLDDNGRPVVDLTPELDAKVANQLGTERAEVALAQQSELTNFPDNASDAFALSAAAATEALAENASFQVAQRTQEDVATELARDNSSFQLAPTFQTTPSAETNDLDPPITSRDPALVANSSAPATPTVAESTSSRPPFNDQPSLPDPFADPLLAPAGAEPSLAASPFPAPSVATLATPSSSLLDEGTAPNDPRLANATPSQSRAQTLDPHNRSTVGVDVAPTSAYAADPVASPRSEQILSTTFNNQEKIEAFNKEEEQFEAALDALRRRGMEGAEIICIVNWPADVNGARETEVVRIPRRATLANPVAPGADVELAAAPNAAPNAVQSPSAPAPVAPTSAPLTSHLPDATFYK